MFLPNSKKGFENEYPIFRCIRYLLTLFVKKSQEIYNTNWKTVWEFFLFFFGMCSSGAKAQELSNVAWALATLNVRQPALMPSALCRSLLLPFALISGLQRPLNIYPPRLLHSTLPKVWVSDQCFPFRNELFFSGVEIDPVVVEEWLVPRHALRIPI